MWQDCIILELQFRKVSRGFGPQECCRIVSSIDLGPKVIRRLLSSCCGLQVVDDDDILIKRSECDDDDVADRKVKELKMLLLIEAVKVVADQSGQSVDIAED